MKKETWNLEEFLENLESHMWAENGLTDEYQDGFSEAIAQIFFIRDGKLLPERGGSFPSFSRKFHRNLDRSYD